MADADVQGMLIRIEATTAQLRQEIARGESAVAQSAGKMDTSLGRIDNAFDRAGSSAQSASGAIKSAIAAAVSAASIGTIIKAADSYSQMSDRIGLATKSFSEYNTVQERLLATANRTYRPLEEAQELYIRTSDSLRSMGLSAAQSMDVMDSFSYLLVTNSASADKAKSAIDAYSKSLQTGKVEADSWQAILAAMPTIVDTLSKSTSKSAEEIRSLGAQGKLSLDTLTQGLRKSAEANGLLADSMGVAVRDAMVALNNAFTVYIGQLNETTDGTGLLASGISVLADNFGTIAEVAGVAAVGALAAYARGLAASAAGAVLATKAAIDDAMARRAQATAVLLAAQADQQKAQTAVFLAEKELAASKTRISGMAVEKQLSIQLAEARMIEARATTALGAAQGAIVGTGRTLLGLLGGPAGIAFLAVGAATAFLTLRDNTSALEKKLGDLSDPIEKLTKRFNELDRAGKSVTLRGLQETISDTQGKVAQMSGAMADKFENDLRNMGAAGADGLMAGLVSLPEDTQAALDLVRKASKDQASGIVVDWKAVADELRLVPGVTEAMAVAIEESGTSSASAAAQLNKLKETVSQLTGETNALTQAERENAAAKAEAAGVGQKYLEQLQKQLATSQDKTAVEAANRFISENKLLTQEMGAEILKVAAAKDAQKAADEAAAKATKSGNSAAKEAATEAKNQAKALADLKTQADMTIASATGLSAAYLDGTDKSREFGLQQKIDEAVLKTGAAARQEVIDKLTAQLNAQDKLNVSKAAFDLQAETADLIAQAKATLQGADALAAYNLQKSMTVALAGKNIEVGSKEYQQLLAANKAQQDAVKIAKQAADAGGIVDRLYPEAKLLREYTLEQDKLNAAMTLYPANAAQYQGALARLGQEYEINRSKATVWGQMTEAAVDRIDDAFADMWKSVLSKSGNFMDTLKNSFRQFLAEMLHMAITKPIIVQLSSSLGVGGMSGQASSLLGGGGAGGGINLESVWDGVSGAYSVATSGFGGAVGAGWTAGEGFLGGVQGAFKAGSGYLSSGISSLFASSSSGAMVNGVYQMGASGGAATVDLISNTVTSSTGAVTGTASAATTAATTGLAASSALMYGIGGAIQGYLKAGVKGAVAGAGGAVAGAYAGAAIGSAVPIIGNVIGAAIGAVLGGMFGSSLFGGEWITKDEGFQLGVADGELESYGFEYQKKKGGLFSSNKKRTNIKALDPELQVALDKTYAATLGTVIGLFDSLDVELNDAVLDGLNVAAIQISTRDKTAEQIQEEIAKWFTGLGDAAAVEINKVTNTGFGKELNLEYLTGFVNNLYSVNSSLKMIGVGMVSFDIVGGRAVEHLVALAGGVDTLNKNITAYYDNFTTDTQKAADTLDGVRAQFAAMGVALPATREGFAAAVRAIDVTSESARVTFNAMTANAEQAAAAYAILEQREAAYRSAFFTESEQTAFSIKSTTDQLKALGVTLPGTRDEFRSMVEAAKKDTSTAGQALYDSLMSVAGAAGTAFDSMEETAKASAEAAKVAAQEIADAIAAALNLAVTNDFATVQRSIAAQQKAATAAYNATNASLSDMSATASKAVSGLSSVGNSLEGAMKSLRGTSDDAVKMLQSQARATLQSALATARAGGSLVGFTGLEDALDTVSDNNTDLYASMDDFARDQGRTANVVAELNAINGKQLSAAERLQASLEEQIKIAQDDYKLAMDRLDNDLANAQAQMDAFNGIDTSIKSVEAAIKALNGSLVAALAAKPVTGAGSAIANSAANNGTVVDTLYQQLFGREADAGGKQFWVDQLASGASTYQDIVDRMTQYASAGDKAYMAGGKTPAYASGGLVSGPGTGTSDSIMARLSNGEYVIRAGAVQAYGTDFLDQMNSLQVPAFAVGGPVLDVAGPVRMAASQQPSGQMQGYEEFLEELRGLSKEVKEQRAYLRQTTVNTGRTETHLDAIRTVGLKAMED